MINKLPNIITDTKNISVYNYNDYNIQDLLNRFYTKINENVDLTNDVQAKNNIMINTTLPNFINWATDEKIPSDVINSLTTKINDGTFEDMINNTILSNINTKVDNFKDTINSSLEQIKKETSLFLFSGFTSYNENLMLWTSQDGISLDFLGNFYFPQNGDMVRDPSIIKFNNFYYITYSTGWDKNYMGLAKSKNLVDWEFVKNIFIPETHDKAWAPELFLDDDNSLHIFCTCSLKGTDNFEILEFHPTNSDCTQWSSGIKVTGNFPNCIDAYVVKKDGKYHIWYTTKDYAHICYASSNNLTYGYEVKTIGNWANWGSQNEGQSIIKLPNGKWRIYFDSYAEEPDNFHYYYSESEDWINWTPKAKIESKTGIRHFSCLCNQEILKDMNYYKNINDDLDFVDLGKATDTNIISSLKAKRNTVYYIDSKAVIIQDIDIRELNAGDKVRFIVFSESSGVGLRIDRSSTVALSDSFNISVDFSNNNTLINFEVLQTYDRRKYLTTNIPTPHPKVKINTWVEPELENGWMNFGGTTAKAGYCIDSLGVVRLKGVIKSGTLGFKALTLPEGFRPLQQYAFAVPSNDSYGQITIDAEGSLIPRFGSNIYVSLDGVSFKSEHI